MEQGDLLVLDHLAGLKRPRQRPLVGLIGTAIAVESLELAVLLDGGHFPGGSSHDLVHLLVAQDHLACEGFGDGYAGGHLPQDGVQFAGPSLRFGGQRLDALPGMDPLGDVAQRKHEALDPGFLVPDRRQRSIPNRADLHPRWNRDGTQVCVDAVINGTRQMVVLNVKFITKPKWGQLLNEPLGRG